MISRVKKVVWTRQAKEALTAILEYRYAEIPTAYKIVCDNIITASEQIIFPYQYQKDEIYPQLRRIIVRDYKILYAHKEGIVSLFAPKPDRHAQIF